jgi:hypothetical protein
MQLIHTAGKEKAAKWFAARRGEAAEYCINPQTKLVFIERNAAGRDKEPVSAMLENFYKREATKLKEHAKDEQ